MPTGEPRATATTAYENVWTLCLIFARLNDRCDDFIRLNRTQMRWRDLDDQYRTIVEKHPRISHKAPAHQLGSLGMLVAVVVTLLRGLGRLHTLQTPHRPVRIPDCGYRFVSIRGPGNGPSRPAGRKVG